MMGFYQGLVGLLSWLVLRIKHEIRKMGICPESNNK